MYGETPESINKRIQRQYWIVGVHVLKVEGSKERWIDITEVNKWARNTAHLRVTKSPLHSGHSEVTP